MDYALRQRGRASVDFLVDLGRCAAALEQRADAFAAASGAFDVPLPADLEMLQATVTPVMRESADFRLFHLVRDWQLECHGKIAMDAFDEIRPAIEAQLESLAAGPTQIEYADHLQLPDYWAGVEFHRSEGGWDGHDYMGFVHGEIIHRRMVGDTYAGIIMQQRRDTARMAPTEKPRRLLELGCGSGQFTFGLADAFPEAELWGVDLSVRQLEECQRRANEHGMHWHLRQANAEATGLPDGAFDLVASYAVFHELPLDAMQRVLDECYRLLVPGGGLLIGDVKAYSAHDDYARWKADFLNQLHGGDPYWREFCTSDPEAMAVRSGFVESCWRGVGEDQYPFVLTARKPG